MSDCRADDGGGRGEPLFGCDHQSHRQSEAANEPMPVRQEGPSSVSSMPMRASVAAAVLLGSGGQWPRNTELRQRRRQR